MLYNQVNFSEFMFKLSTLSFFPHTDSCNLRLPPWLCQPYVRITPEEHLRKLADKQNKSDEVQSKNFKGLKLVQVIFMSLFLFV